MANQKVKFAVFGAVVILAFVVIIGLVIHRSLTRDWICKSWSEIYYEDPLTGDGTCLKPKIQGPCGNNMVLMNDKNNASFGIAVCECDVGHFDRPMIYHEETKQCYFIFTKGYCEEGEWLAIVEKQGPICEPRLCEERPLDEPELVPLRKKDGNRCVELGKFDNGTCNKSQVVRFYKYKIYPTCTNLGTSISAVGVPSHACPYGHFSTGAGHCQPDFDFD